MSCAWYEHELLHGDSPLWQQGLPTAVLREHTRQCSSCAQLVAHEQQLTPLLAGLAATTRDAQPSSAVKQNLLAELEAHHPARKHVFALRFAWTAAAIALIAGILLFARYVRSEKPAPAVTANPPSVSVPSVETPASTTRASASGRTTKPATNPHPHKPAAPASLEAFYPVVMCDSLNCAGPAIAVRVELPASPLAGRSAANSTVMADLLVGEDGQVRGIRFLQ